MSIRFFDMFAGIGGFRSGLEAVGGFECVGHCEIDKYTNQAYQAIYEPKPQEVFFEDATKIEPNDLPDIDLICGGFPCQTFSVAGKRCGFDTQEERCSLRSLDLPPLADLHICSLKTYPACYRMTEAERLRPSSARFLTWGTMCWQVLNSKDFGVPQARKRVYIIGYLGDRRGGEIFSFQETNGKTLVQIVPGREGNRIYSPRGVSITLTSESGGFGGKTGLYDVNLPIKVKTRQGYQLAYPGDSIDLSYADTNTRRGRVGQQIAHTLTTDCHQGYFFIDMNPPPNLTDRARCITARQVRESATAEANTPEYLSKRNRERF